MQCEPAGYVALDLSTPCHDGTTHPVMLPLGLIRLPVEWPVFGGQINCLYVCSGSEAYVRNFRKQSLGWRWRVKLVAVHWAGRESQVSRWSGPSPR